MLGKPAGDAADSHNPTPYGGCRLGGTSPAVGWTRPPLPEQNSTQKMVEGVGGGCCNVELLFLCLGLFLCGWDVPRHLIY